LGANSSQTAELKLTIKLFESKGKFGAQWATNRQFQYLQKSQTLGLLESTKIIPKLHKIQDLHALRY
jgi:hypothetical protein